MAEVAYEDARAELELARLESHRTHLELDALPEVQATETEALEAELGESVRRLDELRLEAAEFARREALSTVLAPAEGVVLTVAPQELAGRRVLAGEEFLRLGEGDADRFEGSIDDLGRAHVAEGMPVRLRVEGYPWLLHGSVLGRAGFVGSAIEGEGFPVKVALEGERRGLVLREGMRATARHPRGGVRAAVAPVAGTLRTLALRGCEENHFTPSQMPSGPTPGGVGAQRARMIHAL